MSVQRFVAMVAGKLAELVPVTSSAGSSSAGSIPALNANGFVDSTMMSVAENEVPAGTVNGTNTVFTLAHTPSPAGSLKLYLRGLRRATPGDFSLSGNTITYVTAPRTGDTHVADYRY